jgi:hypothetical protein
VDQVVASAGADLRTAGYFFGERLKGLRRTGVPVDLISPERWCEFFRTMEERPALWGAWKRLVRRMAATAAAPGKSVASGASATSGTNVAPGTAVSDIVSAEGLSEAPPGWPDLIADVLKAAARDVYGDDPERLERLAMGRCMQVLRGRVPAADVASVLGGITATRRIHERR